jgi:hypothetical protein
MTRDPPLPESIAAALRAGTLAPYIGPGLLPRDGGVPASPAALAAFLGSRVALPRCARGDPWAAAQYIEGLKHRRTLDALLTEAFSAPSAPVLAIHAQLAALRPPLIVDTWFDGGMRRALAATFGEWGELQGAPRWEAGERRWWRAHRADGNACADAEAPAWRTLLHTPFGSVAPLPRFVAADSDHVEVLTELDIQTPIPPEVQRRRASLGFLFLGCRFDDQLPRAHARAILKRSAGPHLFVPPEGAALTRNERAFLEREGIAPLEPVAA